MKTVRKISFKHKVICLGIIKDAICFDGKSYPIVENKQEALDALVMFGSCAFAVPPPQSIKQLLTQSEENLL